MSKRGPVDTLPRNLTPLLGRERELAETLELLGANRLLTITGAGGSGKTSLAIELARRAQSRFPDGMFWVDLASIADPSLIAQQMLAALSIRSGSEEPFAVVLERIADRDLLLVIDNCEHLVDACAVAADVILRSSPRATILATSREPLGIAGEQTWLVPPLAEDDAIGLFMQRAGAVSPDFRLTAETRRAISAICARLDGIPLAIELAAARVRVLSVAQILARLDDAFQILSAGRRTLARHRTIRETIDWSYRLLSADEQILLRRLAVFAGTFSLPAAESICGEQLDVLDLLSALVDKSLVVATTFQAERRYRLLETVRQFALQKLGEGGEGERMRARHAAYFLGLAEEAEPKLFAGAADAAAMAGIDDAISNLRAVFDWAAGKTERTPVALRLIYALHWYWFARGHFHEAQRRVADHAATIEQRRDDVTPDIWARARVAAGHLALWRADWSSLLPSLRDAVVLLRGSSDKRALCSALILFGTGTAFAERDPRAAQAIFEEAKDTAAGEKCDVALALALYWAGVAAAHHGDTVSARASFREAHELGRRSGHKPAIAHPLTVLGQLALRERRIDEAVCCFDRALQLHTETDDRWGVTHVLEGVAIVLIERGDRAAGVRLLAGASAAWLQLGASPGGGRSNAEKEQILRDALDDPHLRAVVASGAAMKFEDLVGFAQEQLAALAGGVPTAASGTPATPRLRIRALGPLEVSVDGRAIDHRSHSARWLELLLFLASHPRGATKEQIGAALWPDADRARVRNNFHVTLHRLRKELGEDGWIVADGETYRIDVARGFEFDAAAFEAAVRATLPLAERSEEGAKSLAQVVSGYEADFLGDLPVGEWQRAMRDRYKHLCADALRTLGRSRMARGDFRAAVELYQRLVALDELDEQAYRNLMLCLARSGDRDASTGVYRRLVTTLQRELDATPDPATEKLHQKIASGQPL